MRRRSLRTSLVAPYAALVVVVAAVLTGTYYWSAHRNLEHFSQQYMHQVTNRIAQNVQQHMSTSGAALDATFPAGAVAADDLRDDVDDLREQLWTATGLFPESNGYIYYGNTAGQSVAMKRIGPTTAQLRLKTRAEQHRVYYQDLGPGTELTRESTETNLFDPRTRPWFTKAQEQQDDFWTTPYVDFTSGNLVVTRGRQVRDASGHFVGAVATDQSLAAISEFVHSLDVGDGGRVFLVSDKGLLLATKTGTAVMMGTHNNAQIVGASHSSDSVIQAVYATLRTGPQAPDYQFADTDTPDAGTFDVAAQRITDDAGLDWLAVVAVPHQTTFAGLYHQLWWALGIGLAAVLLAIGIGIRIFSRIGGAITDLSGAITRIRRGESEIDIPVHRRDEIGELAENFRAMHDELFTDQLTGVANRTALGNILTTFTGAGDESLEFTILFIDLNRFKALNDTYGHDNGDRALIEAAERLGQVLRQGDFLARLGGDEFVIILAGTASSYTVADVTTRIKQAIEQPLRSLKDIPAGTQVTLGAAVGAASWPTDGEDADELVKLADKRMYADKGGSTR